MTIDTMFHDAAAIKSFVTGTLGCRCSEDVFEQIEYHPRSALPGLDALVQRVAIGRRLLIYILDCSRGAAVRFTLPKLVEAGKAERDRNGYNRLRIVLSARQLAGIQPEAESVFSALPNLDERIHLHVLCSESLPALASR